MIKSKLIRMMAVLALAISMLLTSTGMAFALGSSSIAVYENGTSVGTITVNDVGNNLYNYSTHKSGQQKYYTGKGTALVSLLYQKFNIDADNITQLVVSATDSFSRTYNDTTEVTVASLFDGSRKYFPSGGGSGDTQTSIAKAYDTQIATSVADGLNEASCLRFFLGATSTSDSTNDDMVKYVNIIDITD